MIDQLLSFLGALMDQTGLAHLWWGNVVMIAIGCGMIYLAIAKGYEPLLLIGIGFSCIISNVPGSDLTQPGGLFHYAYEGVQLLVVPPLIFFGVGAMTDFAPMIANPRLVILGAAAHLGIFVALIGAKLLGFTLKEAGAIGIIGGADGPMAIFMAVKLAPHLLPQISVAAYSYMALMPLIQPPIMKLLTTPEERLIRMKQSRQVTRLEKIAFPIVIGIVVNLFFPPVAPLITMLMLGNLFREVLVVNRLARTAANDLMNVIIIVLTVAIGSTMAAERFPDLRHDRDRRPRPLRLPVRHRLGRRRRQDPEPFPEGKDQSAARLGGDRLGADRGQGQPQRGARVRQGKLPDLSRDGAQSRRRVRHGDLRRDHARVAGRQVARRQLSVRRASEPTGLPIPPAPEPSRRRGSTRRSGRPEPGACRRCSRSRSMGGCRRPDCRAQNRHGPS